MADFTRDSDGWDRREFLTAATLASAGAMILGAHSASAAAAERYPAIRKAAEAGRDAAIKRIQDWIALPSIAAENRSMKEGAEYMATLAREAGFDTATVVPTDGHPGVSGGGVLSTEGLLVGIPIGRMQGDFRFSFILPLREEMFRKVKPMAAKLSVAPAPAPVISTP